MSVSVLNTTAAISGKTIILAESDQTVTGLHTFDRDPSAPFAVSAGSAVVTNLDADKLDGLEAAALAEIANTETISAVWTFSAKPAFNAAIQFPVAQAASADANALDDYEEGTWTPALGGSGGQSGQAYTTQVGTYVKVGKRVHVQGRLIVSTLGTVTGNAQLTGLPFTSDSPANAMSALFIGRFAGMTTSVVSLTGWLDASATVVTLQMLTAAAASTSNVAQANLSNSFDIMFSLDYIASA